MNSAAQIVRSDEVAPAMPAGPPPAPDPSLARAVIDALAHHLSVLDANGRILMVNRAWREAAQAGLGHRGPACEGADYLAACDAARGPGAGSAHELAAGIREVLGGARPEFALEYPGQGPDQQRWFRTVVTPFPDNEPVRLVVLHEDITRRKHHETTLRWLTGQWLRLQDDTCRQIARGLHDSTSQKLAAIIIGLGVLEDELTSGSSLNAKRLAADSLAAAEDCAQDIRKLSQRLHPALLDELGLHAALDAQVHGPIQQSGLRVDLEVDPNLGRIPEDLALALYRITQECLANVARHSGSGSASIRIARDRHQLVLEARDQGCGIPDPILAGLRDGRPGPGLGLLSMRERANQFAGVLEIEASSQGTTVRVRVPHPAPVS